MWGLGAKVSSTMDTEQKLPLILNPSALCLERVACCSYSSLVIIQSQRAVTINHTIYQVFWSFSVLPTQLWHIPLWLGFPQYCCFLLHLALHLLKTFAFLGYILNFWRLYIPFMQHSLLVSYINHSVGQMLILMCAAVGVYCQFPSKFWLSPALSRFVRSNNITAQGGIAAGRKFYLPNICIYIFTASS